MKRTRPWNGTQRERGFSVVEVLLAATMFGFLVTALAGAMVYGQASTASGGERTRATLLADEGIEATRNIANATYTNLVDGTYGIAQSGGVWTLSGSSDVNGIFTRQVTIATAGTNEKTITSTVTWSQSGGTRTVTVTTRMTNWQAAIVVKSWANPTVAGTATAGAIAGRKVATAGNYAYLVENSTTNNFIIVDISNPAAPSVVSTTSTSVTPTGIAVSGNFAYITSSTATSGLKIYNISNPAAPSLIKTLSFTGTAACNSVFVNGNYAYVVRTSSSTTGSNEFNVVNVTTPASASVVGGYNNNVTVNDVWASGNYAYIARTATSTSTQEMLVISVAAPTAPTLIGSYNPTGTNTARALIGVGNTVFLGYGTTLNSINITNPTTPANLGSFTSVGTINGVDIDATSQYGFLATSSTTGELQVVNIGTPASMTLAKTLDVAGTSALNDVAYNGSLDIAVGASVATSLQLRVFTKN